MNIYEKLSEIQQELKAPKGLYNKFGGFYYRSCENILEAVKPICHKYKVTLVLSDELQCSSERFYVIATATLYDQESDQKIENKAYAREDRELKGMNGAQITGSCSSYARKYALNRIV